MTITPLIPKNTADAADSVPAHRRTRENDDGHRRSPRERRTDDLLERAARADDATRHALLEEAVLLNLPVARAIAARYRGRGEPMDDLEQVAYLALVKAAHGYAPGAGHTFLAYAVPTISGELRRHFRDHGWDVKPPRRVQELRARLGGVAADMTQDLHRSPSLEELAERLGVAESDVAETLAATDCYSALSLDAPCDGATGAPLGETVGVDDDGFDEVVDHLAVGPLLATLSERDRHILCLRFFREWTQCQIAEEIGVTQMQVSRLIMQALAKLRAAAEAA